MKWRSTIIMLLAMTLAACASILGLKHADPSRPFEHRAHVLHGVACTQCHAGVAMSTHDDPTHVPTKAQCTSCHAKPHDTRDCNGCHGELSTRQHSDIVHAQLRFDHGKHNARVHGDCARCHEGVAAANASSLEPTMATCFSCHEHQGEWNVRRCDGCHVNVAAEGTLPESHVIHDGEFIREHGVRAASESALCSTCHDDRSCSKCHGATVPALPWKLAVGGPPQQTGVHLSGFRARHSMEARAQPGLCTTCHAEAFCVECHSTLRIAAGQGGRSPHPAGWVSGAGGGAHGIEARIDPMSCAGCHGGAGEQLCVGCHRVGGPGGNPHGPNFTSTKDKGRELPCRLCHGSGT